MPDCGDDKDPRKRCLETSSTIGYISRRILYIIPLLIGVIVFNFVLIRLAPGDPVAVLAGEAGYDPEYAALIRQKYGLDKPLHEQLLTYVYRVLTGDLGDSYAFRQPVLSLIVERMPATLLLMFAAQIYSASLGIVLGIASAKNPYSMTDNATTVVALLGYSMPVFWVGQMFLIVFALTLRMFPVGGIVTYGIEDPFVAALDTLHHLVLPAIALGFSELATVTRLTRAGMLECLGQDYIITARMKGIDERAVFYRHAFRNALLPVVTYIGIRLGHVLSGALLTETVFGWPGLGRLMYESVLRRDYPLIMGMLVVVSLLVALVTLIVDVAYAFLDPRVRFLREGKVAA